VTPRLRWLRSGGREPACRQGSCSFRQGRGRPRSGLGRPPSPRRPALLRCSASS